jgi:Zn-dependent peptidase ImmA (M78 family)
MSTIAASIPVLQWAAQRARLSDAKLATRFPKWPMWLTGEAQPTLRQLESFARLTHTAFGYFFLPQPPALTLPVPDFRTFRDAPLHEPSSELLDVIYLCQQRQDWYRDHARLHGLPVLPFVGSAGLDDEPRPAAQRLRQVLGLSVEARRGLRTWTDALRQLIGKVEESGVMVMISSVVGSNGHRKLELSEFRGFALADELAPVIFVNGADSKSAQMFTLAHEFAHISLGASGVSDSEVGLVPEQRTERWCNHVAAELLMPIDDLLQTHRVGAPIADEIQRLAREFKVSTLVALRRLFDAGFIDQEELWHHYGIERERIQALDQRSGTGGGDFYLTLNVRTSKRFAKAIVSSTLEGYTSFSDAFRLLGFRKTETFYKAARELEVIL